MKQPLVAPLAALAAGIWAARFTTFTLPETLLSVSLLAALAVVAVRLRSRGAGIAACLTGFFLTGALLASLPRPDDPRDDPNLITRVLDREGADLRDPIRLRGWIREPPHDLGDADRFLLEGESVFRGRAVRGGIRVTVNRHEGAPPLRLDYGQRIEFLARLRDLHNFRNPGGFDFVGYMNRQGVFASASVRPGVPIFPLDGRGGTALESLLWTARIRARERLESLTVEEGPPSATVGRSQPAPFGSDAARLLRAMLLGERDALDRQTTTEFQSSGVYHVLVISGLHVGLLAFLLHQFLRAVWIPRGIAGGLTVVTVAAYALLVGAGTPVLRAAWMLTAYLVTTLVYRQRQALNVIAGTALVFLVADAELLFDPGFQLSFLAVALIAAVAVPLLATTLEPFRIALRDIWNSDRDLHAEPNVADHRVAIRTWLDPLAALTRVPHRWVGHAAIPPLRVLVWAAELAVVSIVVQGGLALPLVCHFHRFSWGAITANLLTVPLLSIVVPAGVVALLTGWPLAATVAIGAAEILARTVHWHAENLPLDTRVPAPPPWLAVLFGLSLIFVALSFQASRRRRLVAAAVSVASLLMLVVHPFPPKLSPGQLEMAVLDVGQGEAIFVAFPEGQTMLVDGGGQPDFRDPSDPPSRRQPLDIGEVVVSPYLWSRSVQKVDVVAVTHAHEDHLGGIPALLKNFTVAELWLGDAEFGPEYRSLSALAASRGTRVRTIRAGQRHCFGPSCIEVLGPSRPGSEILNDQSLVMSLRYGQQRFLLTGDIEQDSEQALIAAGGLRPSEVLKVAHHGSRSSSHRAFLQAVRPSFAVISAGADNFYGHPHQAVLERLGQAGASVLRTDQEGLVSILTDGRRITVDTFRRLRLRRATVSEAPLLAGR